MNSILVAICTTLEVLGLFAAGQDPEAVEVDRATAVKLLSVAIGNPGPPTKEFHSALILVEEHHLVELIPILIQKIDRPGFTVGSIKPWTQEYPCTKALVRLGRDSIKPLLQGSLQENDLFRQKLLVYSLLGILGLQDTTKALNDSLKSALTDEMRKRVLSLLEMATALAPLAPTHFAPKETPPNPDGTVNTAK